MIQEFQVKQTVLSEAAIDGLADIGDHGFVLAGLACIVFVHLDFEQPAEQTGIADRYHMTVETRAGTRAGTRAELRDYFPVYLVMPKD